MKNKGFTLVELIVVIAVISILMLIGVPAFAQIVERVKVRSDKLSGTEIGDAIAIREMMVPEKNRVQYYPTITRYDKLDKIEDFISKTHRPQSMKDGYYFVTALKIEGTKRILVGIGKEEMPVTDIAYNSPKESGWVYINSGKITDFLDDNKEMLNETVTMPENYLVDEAGNESSVLDDENKELKVGQYVDYSPGSVTYTGNYYGASVNLTNGGNWKIFSINNGEIALISENSVGTVTLTGKEGYKNAVAVLNSAASAYVDNYYVDRGRSLGSGSGSVGVVTDPITWEETSKPDGVTNQHKDNIFRTDRDIIIANGSLHTNSDVWLASRFIDVTSEFTSFSVRKLSSTNVDGAPNLYISREKSEEVPPPVTLGLRPIVYLSPDTKITTGEGTLNSKYVLSK